MDIMFTILLQIWLCQKCVPVPRRIMGYHTGNLYYAFVTNAQYKYTSSGRKYIWNKHMFNNMFSCLPQCIMLHCSWRIPILIMNNMLYVFHWSNFCNTCKNIHTKGDCVTWKFNIRTSQQILYFRNPNTDISFDTCVYSCSA